MKNWKKLIRQRSCKVHNMETITVEIGNAIIYKENKDKFWGLFMWNIRQNGREAELSYYFETESKYQEQQHENQSDGRSMWHQQQK